MRDMELKYSDLKISLATKYLRKFQALEQQMKNTALPMIDYGDSAMAAWSQLENAGLKQQLHPVAQSAQNAALGKVGILQSFDQDTSKPAAQSVADKKSIERVYVNAKGC
jgi:hypothetical protein